MITSFMCWLHINKLGWVIDEEFSHDYLLKTYHLCNIFVGCLTHLRATSHMSQGPWPCYYKGPWFSSKVCTLTWFAKILHRTCLLEVDLTQITADYETLFKVYHVGTRVDFLSMIVSLSLRLLSSSVNWTWTISTSWTNYKS